MTPEVFSTIGQQWAYIVAVFATRTRAQQERNKAVTRRGDKVDAPSEYRLAVFKKGLAKAKQGQRACWLKFEFWKTPTLSIDETAAPLFRSWSYEIAREREETMQVLLHQHIAWIRRNYDAEGNPIYPSFA